MPSSQRGLEMRRGDSQSLKRLTTSGCENERRRSEVTGDLGWIAPAATVMVSTVVSSTLLSGVAAGSAVSGGISPHTLRPHWVALSASANRSWVAALTAPTQSDGMTLLSPSFFRHAP